MLSLRHLLTVMALVSAGAVVAAQVKPSTPVKKPIHGLTTMGPTAFNAHGGDSVDNGMAELTAHPGVYKGAVINAIWKMLEPKDGVYDFSSIDAGLRSIAKYNAAHPKTPVVGKLRVYAGPNVPDWLMKLTGGPYPISNDTHGNETIAGYWTPEYKTKWQALQMTLAAKYDADPLMGEVAASSCSSFTDESFIYPKRPSDQIAMRAHGFNDAAERACLLGAIQDYDVWKVTPVDLTFSPYFKTDTLPPVRDDTFTLQVMEAWRGHFGNRGVISNHSVQDPVTDNLKPVFAQLHQVGPPIELQTASQGVISHGKETNGQPGASRDKSLPPLMDWNKVIQNALDTGAGEIEIWTTVEGGGRAQITGPMLKAWADALSKKN